MSTDGLIEAICQIPCIVRPNSQYTLSKFQHHTVAAPQVPHPATTQAHVNSPAVENRGASDFCTHQIVVSDRSSKQGYRPEADRQVVQSVFHGEMMKGRSKYQDEQANRRKYPRNWRHIPKDRAKAEKHDGENVKQQAEWCMLCMLVRRFAAHTILLLVDFFSK